MRDVAATVLWGALIYGFYIVFSDSADSVPFWASMTIMIGVFPVGIYATLVDLRKIEEEEKR